MHLCVTGSTAVVWLWCCGRCPIPAPRPVCVVLCVWSVCISSSHLVGGGVVVVVCLCRVHLSDALHSCAWSYGEGFTQQQVQQAGLCGSDLLHRRCALGTWCVLQSTALLQLTTGWASMRCAVRP